MSLQSACGQTRALVLTNWDVKDKLETAKKHKCWSEKQWVKAASTVSQQTSMLPGALLWRLPWSLYTKSGFQIELMPFWERVSCPYSLNVQFVTLTMWLECDLSPRWYGFQECECCHPSNVAWVWFITLIWLECECCYPDDVAWVWCITRQYGLRVNVITLMVWLECDVPPDNMAWVWMLSLWWCGLSVMYHLTIWLESECYHPDGVAWVWFITLMMWLECDISPLGV